MTEQPIHIPEIALRSLGRKVLEVDLAREQLAMAQDLIQQLQAEKAELSERADDDLPADDDN